MAEETISEFDQFVFKLIEALNNCQIEYLIIGGVAAVYYGRARMTTDCDIIVSLEEKQLKGFCDCLSKHGFQIREYDVIEGFKDKSHFNAFYGDTVFRADFSWKKGTLAEHGFERAKDAQLFGVLTRIEAPEDVIIAKLVYGSPQDREDAKAIIHAQKKLDMEYINKRAEQEGVAERLKQILHSAGK
jgi:hypothetical protein